MVLPLPKSEKERVAIITELAKLPRPALLQFRDQVLEQKQTCSSEILENLQILHKISDDALVLQEFRL